MATIVPIEGYKAAFWLDAAGNGTFAAMGAVNSEELERVAAMAEAWARDPSDIYVRPKRIRKMTSEDLSANFDGYYNKALFDTLNGLFQAGTSRDVRFDILSGSRISANMMFSNLRLGFDAIGDGWGSMSGTMVLAGGSITISDQS